MNAKKSNKKTSLKKKVSAPAPKDELLFELDGHVYIVEKADGKVTQRTELDGKLVLECIMTVLKQSLDYLESNKDALNTLRKK